MTVVGSEDSDLASPPSVTKVIAPVDASKEASSSPPLSAASNRSPPVHVVTHSTTEEFDKEGNVTRVGNLIFLEGILGQGAFGTVRLARRKLIHSSSESTSSSNQTPSAGKTTTTTTTTTPGSSKNNKTNAGLASDTNSSKPNRRHHDDDRRRVGQRQPRHGFLNASASDPNIHTSVFFSRPALDGTSDDAHLSDNDSLEKPRSKHSPVKTSADTTETSTHESQGAATDTRVAANPAMALESGNFPKNISPLRRLGRHTSATNSTSLFGNNSSHGRRHHVQHHNFGRSSPAVGGVHRLGLFSVPGIHSFDDRNLCGNDSDDDEQLVAVKIFSKSLLKRQRTMERDKSTNRVKVKTALQRVEREIALMKKLSHPNLVCLYEVIDSPESDMLYMVLEYMPLGEILTYQNDGTFRRKDPRPAARDKSSRHVDGIVDGHFDEEHAALYFVDILHALAHLHQHHIAHRDLKPENILLDARGIAKLGDFGVSHIFDMESDIGTSRMSSIDEQGRQDRTNDKTFSTQNSHDSWSAASSDGNTASDRHHTLLTRKDTEAALAMGNMAGLGMLSPHHAVLTREEIDAALSMRGMAGMGMLSRTEGTWCFWTPAMCAGSKSFGAYTADMWAAGVCLFIFVTGKLPFYSEVPSELFDMISKAELDYSGLGLSNSLVDLLKSCLEKEVQNRAGVGDCLQHPFLQLARETRIRQLGDEFEISNKSKIVISDEDMRLAFRTVTNVSVQVLRSAGKRIQEGLAHTRDRLSLGDRSKSHSSVSEGECLVKHGHESSKPFRSRMPSMGSPAHSVESDVHVEANKRLEKKRRDSDSGHNKNHRRQSHPSNATSKNGSNQHKTVVFCRRNTDGDSDRSLQLSEGFGLSEGGRSSSEIDRDYDTRTDVSRISRLSSGISFGSTGTDDLRTTFIAENEQDEEKEGDGPFVRFETLNGSPCETGGHSLSGRHETPLGYQQSEMVSDADAADDANVQSDKKKDHKKKRRKQDQKHSKCSVM